MRLHVNFVWLIAGTCIAWIGFGGIGTVVGVLVVSAELYRCRRLASLTSDISANTIIDFYRGDRARRYSGAHSTAREIRKYAGSSQRS